MKHLPGIILVFICSTSAFAQYKVGANLGGATGASPDDYNLSFGIDGYYMLGNPDKFLKVGLNASFKYYVGGETELQGVIIKNPNAQFIPVAGALRFTIFRVLTFGTDVGYGLSLQKELDSAFYLRFVGGIDIANAVEINLTGHSLYLDDSYSLGAVGIGFLIHIY